MTPSNWPSRNWSTSVCFFVQYHRVIITPSIDSLERILFNFLKRNHVYFPQKHLFLPNFMAKWGSVHRNKTIFTTITASEYNFFVRFFFFFNHWLIETGANLNNMFFPNQLKNYRIVSKKNRHWSFSGLCAFKVHARRCVKLVG